MLRASGSFQLLAQLPMALRTAGQRSRRVTPYQELCIHRLLRSLPNSLLRQLLPRSWSKRAHRPSLGRIGVQCRKQTCRLHLPLARRLEKLGGTCRQCLVPRLCRRRRHQTQPLKSSRHPLRRRRLQSSSAPIRYLELTGAISIRRPSCHARSATHGTLASRSHLRRSKPRRRPQIRVEVRRRTQRLRWSSRSAMSWVEHHRAFWTIGIGAASRS